MVIFSLPAPPLSICSIAARSLLDGPPLATESNVHEEWDT
jgi:hypothetical protein